jgi:hypothetical protein
MSEKRFSKCPKGIQQPIRGNSTKIVPKHGCRQMPTDGTDKLVLGIEVT